MEELQPQTPEPTVAQRLERELKREAGEEWQPPQPSAAETTEEPQQAEEETPETESEQEPEEGQPTAEGVVEVELDGKTYQVPAAIKDGYLRQADYTKKTQALAEERKQAEQVVALTVQTYHAVNQLGPQIADWHQTQAKLAEYQNLDWNTLWNTNENLFNRAKMEQQEALKKFEGLSRTLQQAPAMLKALEASQYQAEVARNLPLAKEWVPDLDKRRDEFFEVGKKYGYTEQELNHMSSARDLRALRDLADYQKIIASKDTIQQKRASAPPVARPGTRTVPVSAQKDYNSAVAKLRSGDRSDDAFINALRAQRKLG